MSAKRRRGRPARASLPAAEFKARCLRRRIQQAADRGRASISVMSVWEIGLLRARSTRGAEPRG